MTGNVPIVKVMTCTGSFACALASTTTVAFGIRLANPAKYATIGRTVLAESHERSLDQPAAPPAGSIPAQPGGGEVAQA